MRQRLNAFEKSSGALKAMYGLSSYLAKSTVEQHLQNLIFFRVSQINGCAYCLDMHSKDLRAGGETEQRLYTISAWRDTSLYTDRERAALAWAEAVTEIGNGDVSDDVYEAARKEFSEHELIDLTMAVITINSYNRVNIAFRVEGGSYKAPEKKVALSV